MFMLLIKLCCDLHQVEGGRMAAGNFQVRGADSEDLGFNNCLARVVLTPVPRGQKRGLVFLGVAV